MTWVITLLVGLFAGLVGNWVGKSARGRVLLCSALGGAFLLAAVAMTAWNAALSAARRVVLQLPIEVDSSVVNGLLRDYDGQEWPPLAILGLLTLAVVAPLVAVLVGPVGLDQHKPNQGEVEGSRQQQLLTQEANSSQGVTQPDVERSKARVGERKPKRKQEAAETGGNHE